MQDLDKERSVAHGFLSFSIARHLSQISVTHLQSIEDLKLYHDNMIKIIKEKVPAEYHVVIDSANYFNSNVFDRLRKRTFDVAGNFKREIFSLLDRLEITFNGNIKS